MKILINTTPIYELGGVSNHFKGLMPYWSKDVKYFSIGPPKWRTFLFPYYLLKFCILLLVYRPDVVMINPSMARKAIRRDFTYMKIAEFLGCNIVTMFHGFHVEQVAGLEQEIVTSLNRCSLVYVLSEKFRKILIDWGVVAPILLTTTKVSDELLADFDICSRTGVIRNVLFLARTTKAKGVFVALNIFKALSEMHPDLKFSIVGAGSDLKAAKEMARDMNLPVRFTGELCGDALIDEFKNADAYLFTSYHEGMPTSVLEAMAFGLPIVTRPVGALTDFFMDGKMGFVVDSDKAEDYMEPFNQLLSNKILSSAMSEYNYNYAKEFFLASKVAPKLENEIKRNVKHATKGLLEDNE